MGQALYRKHRSRSLDEVIGQEHITHTLQQALKQGRISHAYLFTGPRGVGKTSVARIWAHVINDLPYADDSTHLDIIEIDAASNRRIDEIRDLRDKVYVSPTSAKYKVYIIDEVHMLTREAFNALLKTLEEPPAHVVFILATTDAHKVPDTIISRTQRFSFRPVASDKVMSHLRHIAQTEKISISDEALELLAEHGEGSFRDTISLLDQASGQASETIDVGDVQELLGIPPAAAINQLAHYISEHGSSKDIMNSLNDLYQQGYQAAGISTQLSRRLRQQLAADQLSEPERMLTVLGELAEVPAAHAPLRYLEIILLKQASFETATVKSATAAPASSPKQPKTPQKTPAPDNQKQAAPSTTQATPTTSGTATEAKKTSTAPQTSTTPTEEAPVSPLEASTDSLETAATGSAVLDEALWPAVLQAFKQRHNTLYGVARMAQPRFESDRLTLAFAFPFHQKRLSEKPGRELLATIIKDLTGQTIAIECIVDKAAEAPKVTLGAAPTINNSAPAPAANNNLSAISNIFGGGELLES